MKTPQEKYLNDPCYKRLVDIFENQIHQANFTPSEIREASILACINYELNRRIPHSIIVNKEASNALDMLNKFLHTQQKE